MNDRMNYLTPTKKPTGYGTDRNEHRTRLSDKLSTPAQRLLTSSVLSPAQQGELTDHRDRLNPAEICRRIPDQQNRLLVLAKDKTEQLHLASVPTALPTSDAASASTPADLDPTPFRGQSLPEARAQFRGHLDMRHYTSPVRFLIVWPFVGSPGA